MTPITEIHRVTLKDLQRAGLPVVEGRVYVRKDWVPKRPISLAALYHKLAKFPGSLAEEIAHLREEG